MGWFIKKKDVLIKELVSWPSVDRAFLTGRPEILLKENGEASSEAPPFKLTLSHI
ncbi:hypothetical protein [Pedobacter sp. KBW06]|uniref:hypothetical protein n=1 Tax=Pedobacter sp. KBW06 TaxID=2153359 RepID=UPI0013157D3C|nr:hypothetical protein [Pedobacter sp. KBW06]